MSSIPSGRSTHPHAYPAPSLSAKSSIRWMTRILRHSCQLSEEDVQPELFRRCKQASPHTGDWSEERIRTAMWKCLHHTITIHDIDPIDQRDDGSYDQLAVWETLRLLWLECGTDSDAVAAFVGHSLHTFGYHAMCRGEDHHTPREDSITPRQQLLALAFIISHTHLIDRYLRMVDCQSRYAWFVPSYHRGGVILPKHHPHFARHTSTAGVFPQPLLPPSDWDSAGGHMSRSLVDQQQDVRLLQQLIQAEDYVPTDVETAPNRSSYAATKSRVTTSARSPVNRHPMCLPPPTESTVIASPNSLEATLSSPSTSTSPSSLHTRLHHRVHQCIGLHGKIGMGMKKIAQLTRQQAQIIHKLQVRNCQIGNKYTKGTCDVLLVLIQYAHLSLFDIS